MNGISKRAKMKPFIVMDTLTRANELERQGREIYRFEAGQPHFKTPELVINAGHKILKENNISYTDPMGLPKLRQEIVKYYKGNYRQNIDISQVVITSGSSAAFSISFLACFEAGDKVIMAMPCYPSYKRILESFNVEVVPIYATSENGYFPTINEIEELLKTEKISGLIIASPNNPTGAVLPNHKFKEILEFCKKNQIRVISDELYHGVEFDEEKSTTAIEYNKEAFVINSFSKYFCMTGWRLGWIIIPKDISKYINNLQSNLFICAPTISQYAAIEAFQCIAELNQNIKRYIENRDLFVKELVKMGIEKFTFPNGGFYIYADISHISDNSQEFAVNLLENAGVAVSSGLDFDEKRGHKTIRFSYVCDKNHAKKGLEKFSKYIDTLKNN